MDSRLKFRPRLQCVNNSVGTQERNASGFVDWPFKGVGASRDLSTRVRGNPNSSRVESTGKKSYARECCRCPYRKPTQVGKASSLR